MWMENSVLESRAPRMRKAQATLWCRRATPMGFSLSPMRLACAEVASGGGIFLSPDGGRVAWLAGMGDGLGRMAGTGGGASKGGMGDSGTVTSSHRLGIRLMTLEGSLLCALAPGGKSDASRFLSSPASPFFGQIGRA